MVNVKEDMTGWAMAEHGVPDSRLTIIKQIDDYIEKGGKHRDRWLCECSCQEKNKIKVIGKHLRNGLVKSCGCLKKEKASINGSNNVKNNPVDFNSEDYAIGYTLKGEPFWFDKEDYDKIKDYCWFYDKKGYVTATEKKTKKTIFLHVLIMSPVPNGMIVDHKQHPPRNGHKKDNRKENLEIKTQSQNMMNASLSSNNTSGVKGVSWSNKEQRWKVRIGINNKQIYIGTFINKQDAIDARKKAEEKYFGKYNYDVYNL
jgi:hypothetical protein